MTTAFVHHRPPPRDRTWEKDSRDIGGTVASGGSQDCTLLTKISFRTEPSGIVQRGDAQSDHLGAGSLWINQMRQRGDARLDITLDPEPYPCRRWARKQPAG
jgi:hypothetical protein